MMVRSRMVALFVAASLILSVCVQAAGAPNEFTFYAAEFGSGAAGAFAGLFVGLYIDNAGLAERLGVAVGQSFGVSVGAMAGILLHGMVQGYQGNSVGLALGVMAGQYASSTLLSASFAMRVHEGELSPETYGVYASMGAIFASIVLGMVGHHL